MRIDMLVPVYVDMWNEGIMKEALKTKAPDVDLHITNLDAGVPSVESFYDVAYAARYVVEKAMELEAAGSQGLVLYCFKDPMLAACKEVLNIPVVGLCDSAITMAHLVGERICVLTSRINSQAQHYRELKGRVKRVDTLDIPVLEYKDHDKTGRAVDEKIAIAAADGCDVVVLACGSMLGFDFAAIEEKYQVQIIRPVACAMSAIDYMVRTGLRQSRLDYPAPDLSKKIIIQ